MFVMIDPMKTSRPGVPVTTSPRPASPTSAAPDSARAPQPLAARSLATDVRAIVAEPAPFDALRVDSIRAAIAEGRYPVEPVRIAAAMLLQDRGA
jgi:flagellar biosynthesis anti-sigma factor FlgM